jgi:transforming growth factor-beta-induced protein
VIYMNKMMITVIVIVVVVVAVGALIMSDKKSSMSQQMASNQPSGAMMQGVMVGGAAMIPDKNIVANALNSKDHTTLVSAVKAAGLVSALEAKGPYTVFAPTNEAFSNLPAGTVQMLLEPQNKAKLTSILEYHVVPGAYKVSDLQDGQMLKTLEGDSLKVTKQGNTTYINGVAITIPDVIDSNGVTQVIGSVLIPPVNGAMNNGVMVGGALMTPDKNIVENALAASDVTTVVAAVKAAGLVSTLEGPGPFTVFAPDNDAFNNLPSGTVDTLMQPANKQKLADILEYHVVKGIYTIADLHDGQTLTAVDGKTLTVHVKDGVVMINNATILTPDVISSNGVTHVIDTVLMPQ